MPNQLIYSGSETILRAGAFYTLLELTLTKICYAIEGANGMFINHMARIISVCARRGNIPVFSSHNLWW